MPLDKKVFITQTLPEAASNFLKENGASVEMNRSFEPLSKKELIKKMSGVGVFITLLTDNIDKEIIDAAAENEVKGFCNYAVGYNNIDVNYAKLKKIFVTNTPDVLTKTTAEMAWALLFSAARRITESHNYVAQKKFNGWQSTLMLGRDVSGKTLGIIGAGRIGTAFGLMSAGFEMKVIYSDFNRNETLEKKINAEKVELNELLEKADFISLHTPLTNDSVHLIGEPQFKLMKKTAIIINTSRGRVIDEKILAKFLKDDKIGYAGLDVFENEPDICSELFSLPNVIMTPHIASGTVETRDKMALLAARNAADIFSGIVPRNNVW
ncbi:MAG TPA: D-glycerate dehydrogenase [bacterium]|nr:D-glycerate dehydrogenase [bacterium]